jgi:MerC mercury resistance protein
MTENGSSPQFGTNIPIEGAPATDNSRGDRTGMLIAALCFVHCVAGPVLLSFAGFASLIGVSERLEPAFLLGSIAMGAVALIPAYRKKHHRLSCLAMFCSGFLCLLVRRRIPWTAGFVEPIMAGAGATLIIAAHVLNLRFSKRCQCCEPDSHPDA